VGERFADDLADETQRSAAHAAAEEVSETPGPNSAYDAAALAAVATVREAVEAYASDPAAMAVVYSRAPFDPSNADSIASVSFDSELVAQTELLRHIVGNPFRPVTLIPAVLAWNDGTVVRLAQVAYQERKMPEGTLDNGRLAVLADALEEAGCSDADILDHLRGPGPHVRGCWVVDQLLGKG
jgi:hypothetical protein